MPFDSDHRDLAATLSAMERESRERTQFNQIEAKQKMKAWLAQDSRFRTLTMTRWWTG